MSSSNKNISVDIKVLDIKGILAPESEVMNAISLKSLDDEVFTSETLRFFFYLIITFTLVNYIIFKIEIFKKKRYIL